MGKEFRIFCEQFKSAWDKQAKLTLGYGEDLKKANQVSKYLWRKSRADMIGDRDRSLNDE
jgi:spore coat polysaccharide biosynthesis protein SpsF (cytidylyltransferase family)